VLLRPWVQLQWGHGDEAVEEHTMERDEITALKASMGPRR